MTKYSFDAVMRAFEERYSISQNKRQPEIKTNIARWGRPQSIRTQQRAIDFEIAAPIPENMHPSLPVQLVAITQLALHLCKRKTPPYRVRRDQIGSNGFYVPRIDWEFHFDTLRMVASKRAPLSYVLLRTNVLHPATLALIDIGNKIYTHDLQPSYLSFEERQALNPEQGQRNLIAKKMYEWNALLGNSRAIKDWSAKHEASITAFLNEWTNHANKRDCFLLRADLIYSSSPRYAQKFEARPHSTVRRDVAAFLKSVQRDPYFTDANWLLEPYADLSDEWQLPLIALIPGSEKNLTQTCMHVQKHWELAADVTGKSMESNFLHMDGEYRFIAHEHLMLDNLEQHLLRAATYFFGTRLIADTSIDNVVATASSISSGKQFPAQITHRSTATVNPRVLLERDHLLSNNG